MSEQSDWPIPPSPCPKCGASQGGAASHPAESRPRPPVAGDATLCFDCGEILSFDKQLRLSIPTVANLREWSAQPGFMQQIEHAQTVIRRFHRLRKAGGFAIG